MEAKEQKIINEKTYEEDDSFDVHEGDEIMGYECECCGNIQGKKNGFGCQVCSGPLIEWYG